MSTATPFPSAAPPSAAPRVSPNSAEAVPAAPFALAESIANAGAILTFAGAPPRHHLVGHFAWLGSQRLFWFTAHGDRLEDGGVLDFDDARVASNDRIWFYRQGKLAATLSPIQFAEVDDPDDYLIAWQLWHGVAPRRTGLIRSSLGKYLEAESDSAGSGDAGAGRTQSGG